MERLKLTVNPRELTGKKVKRLRKEGILPANIFGKDFESVSIQVEAKEFKTLFKEAGETALIDVKLGEKVFPSLINHIQRDPLHDLITHVDFHKVNLKEKITAAVPVILEGESPAVKAGIGLILQTLNEVEVESLPTDIPQSIIIDAEKLTEVGQSVHVKDLKIDKTKVEIKNDPEEIVVNVQNAEMKEVEPEPEVSPAEVEATSEKAEGEEGEAGAEAKAEVKEEKSEG
jgi:large subunit ribosomal protein L25